MTGFNMVLEPFGDRAWLARLATDGLATAWANEVLNRDWPGVVEVVVAYHSVAVFGDPDVLDPEALGAMLRSVAPPDRSTRPGRLFKIPVLYDGEDLVEVSDKVGLSVNALIDLHASIEYAVQAIGFLPGFPYLGELPEPLAGLPRRGSPRTRVPAGSVAIAGRQSCIYPSESPGGWHLLGRTPLMLADLEADFLSMQAGDQVRFEPIIRGDYETLRGQWLDESWVVTATE